MVAWVAASIMRTAYLLGVVGIAAPVLAASPGAPEASPSFSNDIWPILEARCISCHQAGEIGPMPLTSYQQVRPWARAIRQAVITRAMPPWHASPEANHSFRNDRSLS